MPRRESLAAITPNRFYEIDATLKYQHVGPNSITGIIEENNHQTKIMIPKDGIELEEGKNYIFKKCFNSRNGWLYAKNPSETVVPKL
jgi:sensor c-di-GMP phosphodiesterase-like protein